MVYGLPARRVLFLTALHILQACASQSVPVLDITTVNPRVHSAIGATLPPSYENWGHNNNLSFVIGDDGVLVVNGGDNYALAAALHRSILEITAVPVRWVVNENGQGHAFLGNAYWRDQGVPIIAHADAAHEIETRGEGVLAAMLVRSRERGAGSRVVVPDITFESTYEIDLGGLRAELKWFGDAHSPGDISVWLPDEKILIAGDIAFHERLLGIFEDTNVTGWLASFERMAALEPAVVVPGHGGPTTLAEIRTWTHGYLEYLVAEVEMILDAGGGLAEAYEIDQTAYSHLDTFAELAAKNAGRVFQQLELEFF